MPKRLVNECLEAVRLHVLTLNLGRLSWNFASISHFFTNPIHHDGTRAPPSYSLPLIQILFKTSTTRFQSKETEPSDLPNQHSSKNMMRNRIQGGYLTLSPLE
ncbi:hypothetical protein J3458_020226 [Metarhizium acridum]|uniref:uncharacterized protein n=1 Tax=Metarhizium acridum TaxID=92637 RepID=UPI001C6C6420|nr:hypothetical protein J3458_020226 [Metarhizium acridum]